ncbi:MAG: hypothetical protein JXR88_00580 [Clostridia bacterium]|nr:hypothetical protein [Clostridia bacterium]
MLVSRVKVKLKKEKSNLILEKNRRKENSKDPVALVMSGTIPRVLENDIFFVNLIKYADLLLLEGEEKNNVMGLMVKYKRNYKVFQWLIDFSHLQNNRLLELQLIEEGITWCHDHGDHKHLEDLYQTRKIFYSNL